MREKLSKYCMVRIHLFLGFILFFSCNSNESNTYSFKMSDYVYKKTQYTDEKIKVGDLYVNKKDSRLTLKRFFFDDDSSVISESFYLNRDRFGPSRYYNRDGTLALEIINYAKFDSTKYTYDKANQIMERKR
jgi:hypothetical protein